MTPVGKLPRDTRFKKKTEKFRVFLKCVAKSDFGDGLWDEDFARLNISVDEATLNLPTTAAQIASESAMNIAITPKGHTNTSAKLLMNRAMPYRPRFQASLGGGFLFTAQNSMIGALNPLPSASVATYLPLFGGRFEGRGELDGNLYSVKIRGGLRFHVLPSLSQRIWNLFIDAHALSIFQFYAPTEFLLSRFFSPWLGFGAQFQFNRAWRFALSGHVGLIYPDLVSGAATRSLSIPWEASLWLDWIPKGESASNWFFRARYFSMSLNQGNIMLAGYWNEATFEIGWGTHPWPSTPNRWGVGL